MHASTTTSSPAASIRPGSWAAWRIALRPRTLWIATVPVIVATSLAWALAGVFEAESALIAFAVSLLMQVLTNLQNDVGYTERRVETGERVGLPRATANGWLSRSAVNRAIAATIAAAAIIALPLLLQWGWPILVIGVASTFAAYGYMGGPRPIAYTPFGELTVFVFFGLTAVCGSYYVQAGEVGAAAWLAGVAIGAHAAAVLLVNNYRDRAHDAATGRQTLPVVIGATASVRLFAALELLPFALVVLLAASMASAWLALPVLALPWALRIVRDLAVTPDGPAQNALLFRAVMLELAFGMLFAAGAVAHRAL
jgi:1,4-dihydroxy-2-naphthoate octaprenyltransferase